MEYLDRSDEERDNRFSDSDNDSGYSHEREYDDGGDVDDEGDSQDSSGTRQEVESGTSSDPEILRHELETMRRRYSGASRRINEEIQRRTAIENQYHSERTELLEALMRERVQDLPPEEQHQKMDAFRRELANMTEREQWQAERQMAGMAVRQSFIQNLSQKYGVDADDLEQFQDAETMEWFAQREASRNKKQDQTGKRNRSRSSRGREDRVENTSSPPRAPKTLDEGENEFLRLARRRR